MGPALGWAGPSVGEPPSSCSMPTATSHAWSASLSDHLLSLSHAFSSSGPWRPVCLAYQLLRATCAGWPHVGELRDGVEQPGLASEELRD